MPLNPTTFNVKDAANADKSMISFTDGSKTAFANAALNANGDLVNPATAENQATMNTGISALNTVFGATNDAAASSDTGTFSLIALFKRLLSRTPALGSTTAANASPVAIATDQLSTLATAANQATGNTSQATIATNTGRIPVQGAANAAASMPVVIATDQVSGLATAANQATMNASLSTLNSSTGATNDSAATTDTGTFSLIALFKRALQSLTTLIGNTGAGSVSLTNTPTVTAGAYSTGMVAGGKQSFANAVRVAGGSGIIQSVSVSKKTALTAPYDVYFFNADPAASFTDNAVLPDITADLGKLVGVAHCTDLVDNGTPKTLQASNLAIPFKLATGTTLYAVAVIRGAETLASTSALVFNVGILQD